MFLFLPLPFVITLQFRTLTLQPKKYFGQGLASVALPKYVTDPRKCEITTQDPGVCLEKSNRRAIERPFPSLTSGDASLRFRVLFRAFTPGPVEFMSTFPSTSSKGLAAICVVHLGNFEGNVG